MKLLNNYFIRIIAKRKATFNPISEVQYKSILIGSYIRVATNMSMSQIHNSQIAFNLLKPHFNEFCEEFWLINLNSCLATPNLKLISRGTLNFCLVHPRDLFREALIANSYALIIAHNHPSLNIQPTPEDIKLTNKLIKISKIIEIPILDHIIFTDKIYYSFKENRLI